MSKPDDGSLDEYSQALVTFLALELLLNHLNLAGEALLVIGPRCSMSKVVFFDFLNMDAETYLFGPLAWSSSRNSIMKKRMLTRTSFSRIKRLISTTSEA